jgi:ABC-type transport system substrate-binding protein
MTNSSWPIYTTGPEQINFHLSEPISFFPGLMMDINMVDMQYVLDHGGVGTPTVPNSYLNSHAQPGTGPYVITSYSEGSWIEFAQNPTYWGRSLTQAQIAANPMLDPGHVKNVIVYYKSDDIARYIDVSTGTAQISAVESADWPAVTNNPAMFSYLTLPPSSIMFFGISLNTNLYPTNITDVRQAIVHAINYTDFIQKVFQGRASQFVGPEEPLFKQFYDLGNYSLYSYNQTLAEQDLAAANIKSMPTIIIRTISGCDFCTTAAQVIQADLTQIGIPTNIEILASSDYWEPYGNYQTNVQDASQLGQISFTGGETWAGDAVPASNWVFMVSNESVWGNWAGYFNPKVQACVNGFTNGTPLGTLLSLCTIAQGQIYNDAAYVWFTPQLWWIDGSLVWLKNGPVRSFYVDPLDTAWNTAPLFNTVTFK